MRTIQGRNYVTHQPGTRCEGKDSMVYDKLVRGAKESTLHEYVLHELPAVATAVGRMMCADTLVQFYMARSNPASSRMIADSRTMGYYKVAISMS